MAKRGRRKRTRPESGDRKECSTERVTNGVVHGNSSTNTRETRGNKRPKTLEVENQISYSSIENVEAVQSDPGADTDHEMIVVDDAITDTGLPAAPLGGLPPDPGDETNLDPSDLGSSVGSRLNGLEGQAASDSSGIDSMGVCYSQGLVHVGPVGDGQGMEDNGHVKTEIFDPSYQNEMNELLTNGSTDCMMDIPLFHEVDSLMNIKHEDHLNDTVFYLPMSCASDTDSAAIKVELGDGTQVSSGSSGPPDTTVPGAVVVLSPDGNKIEINGSAENGTNEQDVNNGNVGGESESFQLVDQASAEALLPGTRIGNVLTAAGVGGIFANGVTQTVNGLLTLGQIKGGPVQPLGPVILNPGLVAVPVALTQELLKGTLVSQQPILYNGILGTAALAPAHPSGGFTEVEAAANTCINSETEGHIVGLTLNNFETSTGNSALGENESADVGSRSQRSSSQGESDGLDKDDDEEEEGDPPEIDRFVICSDHTMECVLCAFTTESYSAFKSHIICSHPCWRITKKLSKNRLLVEKSVRSNSSFASHLDSVHHKSAARKEDERDLAKISKKGDKTPRKRQLFERNKRLFKCSLCLRLFVFEGSVVNHVYDHHGQRRPYDFIHISNDHGQNFGPIYRCEEKNCYFSCESEHELEKHSEERHTQVIYRCQLCGYTADNAEAVRIHGIRMHRQQLAKLVDSTP